MRKLLILVGVLTLPMPAPAGVLGDVKVGDELLYYCPVLDGHISTIETEIHRAREDIGEIETALRGEGEIEEKAGYRAALPIVKRKLAAHERQLKLMQKRLGACGDRVNASPKEQLRDRRLMRPLLSAKLCIYQAEYRQTSYSNRLRMAAIRSGDTPEMLEDGSVSRKGIRDTLAYLRRLGASPMTCRTPLVREITYCIPLAEELGIGWTTASCDEPLMQLFADLYKAIDAPNAGSVQQAIMQEVEEISAPAEKVE